MSISKIQVPGDFFAVFLLNYPSVLPYLLIGQEIDFRHNKRQLPTNISCCRQPLSLFHILCSPSVSGQEAKAWYNNRYRHI